MWFYLLACTNQNKLSFINLQVDAGEGNDTVTILLDQILGLYQPCHLSVNK